jgi:hypothetical protein
MNIKKYDNKLIRLKDFLGDIYEGECTYSDKDCTEFMYGVAEESLKISCCLFYKSTIKEIEEIKEYSNDYGYLEEVITEDIDLIEEVFELEDNNEIYRVLLYIQDKHIPITEELIKLLNNLIKYNEEERVVKLAKELKNRKD